MCVAEVNGIIYVIGGCDNSGYVTANEAYNPETNTWSSKAGMKVAMQGMAAAVVDGIIYVVGGKTTYSSSTSGRANTLYSYDPSSDTWTQLASMTTARDHVRAISLNGMIYAIGGWNDSLTDLNTVERYNPKTNTWTTMTPLKTARRAQGIISYNGKIFVLGGSNTTSTNAISSIEEYDPDTNAWSDAGLLKTAVCGCGACVIKNSVFVYGGADTISVLYKNVEQYIFQLSAPTLSATASDKQVSLSWGNVTNAASYNVYRATTSGGTYTQIASGQTGTSYTDTGVTNGTTYYYVVTAVDSFGTASAYSNEVSATPVTSGNALLRITMITGESKEYDLTANEASAFVSWYNGKTSAVYTINAGYNLGSLKSRKDYIAYDKIAFFEVMAYNTATSSTSSAPETYTIMLKVTMATGDEKEYEMTAAEFSAFTTWYSSGAVKTPAYSFAKTYNVGPFTSRTDYLAYNMISDFEVMDY